jgi:hypothetical protein
MPRLTRRPAFVPCRRKPARVRTYVNNLVLDTTVGDGNVAGRSGCRRPTRCTETQRPPASRASRSHQRRHCCRQAPAARESSSAIEPMRQRWPPACASSVVAAIFGASTLQRRRAPHACVCDVPCLSGLGAAAGQGGINAFWCHAGGRARMRAWRTRVCLPS